MKETGNEKENPQMKKLLKIVAGTVLALVFISVVSLLVFGRNDHDNLKGSVPEQLDQYLNEQAFLGAVLISKDGKALFSKGYGEAAKDLPNSPTTLYQIASLSKSFTAVAVMQLSEKNLLSIDDPIAKYLPDVPHGEEVTVAHLLSHSSGIPDYLQPKFQFDYSKAWKPLELYNVVRDADLEFTPGTSFHYSNTGYVLLGLIIEEVSGQSYADYIKEHIFMPSGMNHSMFSIPEGTKGAAGHVGGKAGPAMDNSAAYAAGDIISTAEDLARFDQSLRDGILLSKDTANLMETTHASKFPYQYGYGWYTQEVMGHKAVGHSGGYPRIKTSL
jgi:CubicO group peptidase (beta-lactamase class C family)